MEDEIHTKRTTLRSRGLYTDLLYRAFMPASTAQQQSGWTSPQARPPGASQVNAGPAPAGPAEAPAAKKKRSLEDLMGGEFPCTFQRGG